MLMPKKTKHRKMQKNLNFKSATSRGSNIEFGKYALKALEPKWITSRQIESARRAMTRHVKRGGKIWIRIFPDKPITQKPQEVRMGGGKGAPDHFVSVVEPGRILFEMAGVSKEVATEALKLASYKLPIKTKVIIKEER